MTFSVKSGAKAIGDKIGYEVNVITVNWVQAQKMVLNGEELHHANERLKAANLELEQISMIDGLTSIENRRTFDIAYKRTWKMCLRERMPLALIMVDIDNSR